MFDTLNAKAALFAAQEVFAQQGRELPIMLSGTITDASGRTLSGQTPEAFAVSTEHANLFSLGLNCALGADLLRPHLRAIAANTEALVSVHPNAGLPNAFGEYDETPEHTASVLADFAREGLVNIVGGCCGTTPEHIRAQRIATGEADLYPRLGRTMEWDTAAGDAILRGAGGEVVRFDDHTPLTYGKPGFENPFFIAYAPGVLLHPQG